MARIKIAESPYSRNNNLNVFSKHWDLYNPLLVDNPLKQADALLLWGGTDIHPSFYGEERNAHSEALD